MKPMIPYCIPDDVLRAHYDNDPFILAEYRKMAGAAREDEDSYFKLTKAMIYLEEVANSAEARSFDFTAPTEKIKVASNKFCQIKIGLPISVSLIFLFMFLKNIPIIYTYLNYRTIKNMRKDFRTRCSLDLFCTSHDNQKTSSYLQLSLNALMEIFVPKSPTDFNILFEC